MSLNVLSLSTARSSDGNRVIKKKVIQTGKEEIKHSSQMIWLSM